MRALDAVEWACALCGLHIQNNWVSRATSPNTELSWNILPGKLFRRFRRPQLWATGDWQLHHNNAATHVLCLVQRFFFLTKHQITQVTQPPYGPNLVLCDFWLFSKLKWPLKGKRYQIINEIQENTMEQLMGIWRSMWGPKVPILKGTEASLSYVQCYFFLFFSKIFLSISRERRMEGERRKEILVYERNIDQLPRACQLGTWPTTQACAVTGNWTCDL